MFSFQQILGVTLLVTLFSQTWATTMLSTPHVVSGVVFDDWNSNGLRDLLEPGISSVVVSLWYLPAGQYSVLTAPSKYIQVGSYHTRIGSDQAQGQFQFTCLAAGTYKVGVHLSTTRPGTVSPPPATPSESSDNDIVSVSGGIGWTAPFQAEEAGSTEIGIGLVQTLYAVAFSLTGDQTVPPTVTTTTGAAYAVLNSTGSQMYFRIVRGPWVEGQVEEPGGFFLGWADEAPGYQVRSLADVSEKKENVWFVPKNEFVQDLIQGRMMVQLTASGSFSEKGRLRGQFARFRRSTYIQTMIPLEGSSVVPIVSTNVHGNAVFYLDISRKQLRYDISYSHLNDQFETAASLNGPAAIGTNGPAIYQLPLGPSKVGTIDDLTEEFMSDLMHARIYVSISTDQNPNGLLRGQIRAWQQVQYQVIENLDQQIQTSGSVQPFGRAVSQIDLERLTLTYFVSYGGLTADEESAVLVHKETYQTIPLEGPKLPAYQDGVKQGFVYLTTTEINDFLQGKYRYVINTIGGQTEVAGDVVNWS